MTQQEIADELGMTQQAAYALLRKALRKFRRNWKQMFGDYEENITDSELLNSNNRGIIRSTLGTDTTTD